MSCESYEGVVQFDNRSHAAIIRIERGLVSSHVVVLEVSLEDGSRLDLHRWLPTRPLLRGHLLVEGGDRRPIAARARDEHERSFDLFVDETVVGNVRLGQRIVLEGAPRTRDARGFGLAKAAA